MKQIIDQPTERNSLVGYHHVNRTWISGTAIGNDFCWSDKAKQKAADVAQSTKDAAADPVGKGDTAKEAQAAVQISPGPYMLIKGMPGGPAALAKIDDFFNSAGKALQEIKDAESAKAALPKLKELSGATDGLSKSLDSFPGGAKSAFAPILGKDIGELKTLVDKIMVLPGVEAVIKPTVTELMGKLNAILENKEERPS